MKTLLSSVALVALLAAAPAFAQDPAPVDQPAATQPAVPADQAPAANQPVDPGAATPALPDTSAAAPAEAPAAAIASSDMKFLGQQASDQQLASTWIGKTVYNANGDNLGDINDLVLGQNGQVEAIVLGVGGFLGIGEKSVAVPFEAIQATTDANGTVKLSFNATKEQLDAAPDFQTVADQRSKAEAPAATDAPVAPATPAPAQ